MKKIETVIKPFRVDEVKGVLTAADMIGRTTSELMGFGRQRSHEVTYRGDQYQMDFVFKVKTEKVIRIKQVGEAVGVIADRGYTGKRRNIPPAC